MAARRAGHRVRRDRATDQGARPEEHRPAAQRDLRLPRGDDRARARRPPSRSIPSAATPSGEGQRSTSSASKHGTKLGDLRRQGVYTDDDIARVVALGEEGAQDLKVWRRQRRRRRKRRRRRAEEGDGEEGRAGEEGRVCAPWLAWQPLRRRPRRQGGVEEGSRGQTRRGGAGATTGVVRAAGPPPARAPACGAAPRRVAADPFPHTRLRERRRADRARLLASAAMRGSCSSRMPTRMGAVVRSQDEQGCPRPSARRRRAAATGRWRAAGANVRRMPAGERRHTAQPAAAATARGSAAVPRIPHAARSANVGVGQRPASSSGEDKLTPMTMVAACGARPRASHCTPDRAGAARRSADLDATARRRRTPAPRAARRARRAQPAATAPRRRQPKSGCTVRQPTRRSRAGRGGIDHSPDPGAPRRRRPGRPVDPGAED